MLVNRKNNTGIEFKKAVRQFFLLLALACLSFSVFSAARFEVSHAQTSVTDGKYFLNADIAYSLHSEALDVLEKGLPVTVELQVELYKLRRYWRDINILKKSEVYIVQYNAITERYVLSIPEQQSQQTFATAQEAIAKLRYLENIYLTEVSAISEPKKVEARARLIVDVRHFPSPMQYLAKYWDDWHLVSEWYVWPLKL